jgi:hypothetical protein
MLMYQQRVLLCTVLYSFLMISSEFCDLSLLHWPLFRAVEMWGGQCGKKNLLYWALEACYNTVLDSLKSPVGAHVHKTTWT